MHLTWRNSTGWPECTRRVFTVTSNFPARGTSVQFGQRTMDMSENSNWKIKPLKMTPDNFWTKLRTSRLKRMSLWSSSTFQRSLLQLTEKLAKKMLGLLKKDHPDNSLETSEICELTDLFLCTDITFDRTFINQLKKRLWNHGYPDSLC